MITFKPTKYKRTPSGINILKYEQIESITEELLKDYDYSYLTTPKELEMEDFAINYLEAHEVDYQYIWTKDPRIKVLGVTTFNDCEIPIINGDIKTKELYPYNKHSIIIDRSLVDGTRDAQFGITAFHECGHLYLHKRIYEEMEGQLSLTIDGDKTICSRTDIESYKKNRMTSDHEWLEWQATIFAVTIALNSKSVSVFMNEVFKKNKIKEEILILDNPDDYGFIHNYLLPQMSSIYGISKEAVFYRLMKLGYIKSLKDYEKDKAQLTIYDI